MSYNKDPDDPDDNFPDEVMDDVSDMPLLTEPPDRTQNEEVVIVDDANNNDDNEAVTNQANDSQNETQQNNPRKAKKRKAPVWSCADFNDETKIAKCNFCDRPFTISDGSTSTLVRHIELDHPEKEEVKLMVAKMKENKERIKKQKEDFNKKLSSQPKLTLFVNRKGPIDAKRKQLIDEFIVKHIIKSNEPFSLVEEPSFRALLFQLDPNYICPSRVTITKLFDNMAEKVQADLKKEMFEDILDVGGSRSIHIMTDHGVGNDVMKTKKNVVIVSRITKDWKLKTDTVAIITCTESQTGANIKKSVKEALEKSIGFDSTCSASWVSDGAPNVASARKPSNHRTIGMNIVHDGWCVDHLLDLCGQDSLKQNVDTLSDAIEKMKKLVNFFGKSTPARQFLAKKMIENGLDPKRTVRGTSNRFFTKYFEVDRFVEIRSSIELFFEEYESQPDNCDPLDEEEWELLVVYKDSLKLIVKSSEILEGRDYITSSSVIPFLDTIYAEIEEMSKNTTGEGKKYLTQLLSSMKKQDRFGPDLFKTKVPYNCLTLLDVRYGDIYFDEEQKMKAIDDILNDRVYSTDRTPPPQAAATAQTTESTPAASSGAMNPFMKRREMLLAKSGREQNVPAQTDEGFRDKLLKEIEKLISLVPKTDPSINLLQWLKEHQADIPILSKYWLAYGAFPATSCNAERVFNLDTLIVTDRRY